MNVYLYNLGARVKLLRKQRELTLVAFAELCGFDQPYASRLEAGKLNPTYLTILKIASVLKVPAEDLTRAEVPPLITTKKAKRKS